MESRLVAGALLSCGNQVLMMKRSEHKALAPGVWSCIGGHLEPDEINTPSQACLREIWEETGIAPERIHNL